MQAGEGQVYEDISKRALLKEAGIKSESMVLNEGPVARAVAGVASRWEADVIVVNTCSFIDTAKQESVDAILEMARHKTEGRARKLIVTGCLVERYRDEIQKNIPEIDAVLGTGELSGILSAAGMAAEESAPPLLPILSSSGAVAPHAHRSASQRLKGGIAEGGAVSGCCCAWK